MKAVPVRDFDPCDMPAGQKRKIWLEIAARADGGSWRLPLLSIRGAREGPTLLVLAGVHGDEYEGIAAIPQVYSLISPADMRGALLMLPVCNPPAYEAALRVSPIDGLNLARVFPGQRDGTITRQLAFWITEKLLRRADFLIDLHTGGIAYTLPLLIGCIEEQGALGATSLAAARAFGAPIIWEHPLPLPAGRSISSATELGIPSLYTEAPGGGGCDSDVVDCFREGTLNVMKHLGMTAGDFKQLRLRHHLVGDGNLDTVISAHCAGFFERAVGLLDDVRAGDLLGRIRDEMGEVQAEIRAEQNGVVIMLRGLPRVRAGDGVVHITQRQFPSV